MPVCSGMELSKERSESAQENGLCSSAECTSCRVHLPGVACAGFILKELAHETKHTASSAIFLL